MANFFDRSRYFGGLDRAAGNGWHGGGRRQSWQPGNVNQPTVPAPSPPVTGLPINAMLANAGQQQPQPIVSQVPHLPPGPPVLPPPAAATSLPLAPDGVRVGADLPPPPVTAFGTAALALPQQQSAPVQPAQAQAQPALTPDGAPTPQGPPIQAQAPQQPAPVAPVAQAMTANVGQPGMVQRQPQSDDEQRRQQQGTPQQADYMKPLARMAGGGGA